MKIETGKFFINRTRKFLLPCLKEHGEMMMKAVNNLEKLAVGIGDEFISDSLNNSCLFILVDIRSKHFQSILKWVRKQPFFVKDYPFDDVMSGYQHMIVVKIPEEYELAHYEFQKGKYSRMYTREQIDKLFGDVYMDVLVRDKDTLIDFVDTINRIYDADIQYELWEGEVDFPPKMAEEIFNLEGK